MMKSLSTAFVALVLMAALYPTDAEARRFGGASSLGAQRQITALQKPQPAATSQQSQAAQTAPRTGMGRWLAPLAALAAGLGLATLFGEQVGTLIVALLLAIAVIALFRLVARLLLPEPAARDDGIEYASFGRETVAAPPPSQLPTIAAVPGVGEAAPRIPAGFDVDGFLRQARKNFISLQAAHDRGDLETIRDLVTEEMFEALERDVISHSASGGHTDVVTLDASLLEVTTEGGAHRASIRFSGILREERDGVPAPFEEIWNLEKPAQGRSGWLLAGIQQVS